MNISGPKINLKNGRWSASLNKSEDISNTRKSAVEMRLWRYSLRPNKVGKSWTVKLEVFWASEFLKNGEEEDGRKRKLVNLIFI